MSLRLTVLTDRLAICRLAPTSALPAWAITSPFFAVTRTPDELSVVCQADRVPSYVQSVGRWRAFKVAGPLDFSLTGILAALAAPLAEAGISLFALSTYDTDYILVRETQLEAAAKVLRQSGHAVGYAA